MTAAGDAVAAAMIGMGTAHADVTDTYPAPDPYDVLFGSAGTAAGTQGYDNNVLDSELLSSNPSQFETFTTAVNAFEETAGDHGLENLIYAIDPSAFYDQTSTGITGTADAVGGYLVPDDALGYLATGLDYGLLTPTGLADVLTPLIDVLLGSTPGI